MGLDGDQRVHRCRGALEGHVAVDHDHESGVPGHGHVALDPDHDGRARRRVKGEVLADPHQHATLIRGALCHGGGRQQEHQCHDQDRTEGQQSSHITTSAVQRTPAVGPCGRPRTDGFGPFGTGG